MPTRSFSSYFEGALQNPESAREIREEMATLDLGLRLAEARKNAGLSLDGLADRSGVAKTTILRIEHGASSPTISTLQRLALALGKRLEVSLV